MIDVMLWNSEYSEIHAAQTKYSSICKLSISSIFFIFVKDYIFPPPPTIISWKKESSPASLASWRLETEAQTSFSSILSQLVKKELYVAFSVLVSSIRIYANLTWIEQWKVKKTIFILSVAHLCILESINYWRSHSPYVIKSHSNITLPPPPCPKVMTSYLNSP